MIIFHLSWPDNVKSCSLKKPKVKERLKSKTTKCFRLNVYLDHMCTTCFPSKRIMFLFWKSLRGFLSYGKLLGYFNSWDHLNNGNSTVAPKKSWFPCMLEYAIWCMTPFTDQFLLFLSWFYSVSSILIE